MKPLTSIGYLTVTVWPRFFSKSMRGVHTVVTDHRERTPALEVGGGQHAHALRPLRTHNHLLGHATCINSGRGMCVSSFSMSDLRSDAIELLSSEYVSAGGARLERRRRVLSHSMWVVHE
jgi:hypothetical protein